MTISIGTETRAAVLGFGVEGRSVLAWLRRRECPEIRVISTERPAELPLERWRFDGDPAALAGIDLLVKSPGVKPSHPLLDAAGKSGVRVETATTLFLREARVAGLAVVGVTGSKGKSTTATLIHLTLRAAGIPTLLVGNIGRPALDLVEEAVSNRPVVVFEMSSYQTHDLDAGPSVAVITRLFPEHLDWHGSVEAYFASKLRIASSQRLEDLTIWNATDPEIARRVPLGPARHVAYGAGAGVRFEGGQFRRGEHVLFSDAAMRLRGPHNRQNACAALTAAAIFGAKPEHLEGVLASFAGLPHRLEDLGVHEGVRWINDSIATAPEAAVAALEAFDDVGTLIAGGTDRGFDFGPLARALAGRRIASVILVPPGGPAIHEAILAVDARYARAAVSRSDDLAGAVTLAARTTPAGRTVLFSPASPSYGLYRNFEERGEAFRRLVEALSRSGPRSVPETRRPT